jgi:hypothetical protein
VADRAADVARLDARALPVDAHDRALDAARVEVAEVEDVGAVRARLALVDLGGRAGGGEKEGRYCGEEKEM